MKYRSDLYSGGQRIEGHIIVDEQLFIWKPFLPSISKQLLGIDVFEVPIADLEGYKQKGKDLVIGIHGLGEYPRFYTKHSKEIIEAIKNTNPLFRMYSTTEITEEFNWQGLIELGICIIIVVIIIFLKKIGVL